MKESCIAVSISWCMCINSIMCSLFRMFAVVSMLCRVVFEAYISAWLAIGSD